MSRSETLRLIAFFAAVILIGCLLAACIIQYGNTLPPENNTSSPSPLTWIPEKDGLTIVSHGVEISTKNDTVIIEQIEHFIEKNYGNYSALTSINTRDTTLHGVALAIQYPKPQELLCEDDGKGYLVTTPVQVHKIVVTIPDEPGWEEEPASFVVVYGEDKRFCHAIHLPVEKANELLNLLGIETSPTISAERVPGLSIISHQNEIIPENGTLIVEKMELLAEENLQNRLATLDPGNIKDCKRYGTVALMQYTVPREFTLVDRGWDVPVSHTITVDKIIITIPDTTERRFGPPNLEYRVLLYGSGNPEITVLGLPADQANELRELIGLKPVGTTQ